MKLNLMLAISALSFALVAQAAGPTLGDNMDQIKTLFNAISQNVNNSAMNTQSATQAGQLAAVFTTVKGQVPDAITQMPQAQQAAAIADYQSLIQQEINDATKLQADFEAGNNSDAASVLTDMNNLKTEGHKKYNP